MRECGVGIWLVAALALVSSCQQTDLRVYSIKAVYFDAKRFRTTAECLEEAQSSRLPLDLCTMEDGMTAKPGGQSTLPAGGN